MTTSPRDARQLSVMKDQPAGAIIEAHRQVREPPRERRGNVDLYCPIDDARVSVNFRLEDVPAVQTVCPKCDRWLSGTPNVEFGPGRNP